MTRPQLRLVQTHVADAGRRRGFGIILYRTNEVNRCPGCGRSHWHVGRQSAECGFCGTVLPFQEP